MIKKVAKKAGVSAAIVSRALNPETQGAVKPETVWKIQSIVSEFGYLLHSAVGSLSRGQFRTIGLPVNLHKDTNSGYVGNILKGILKGLDEIGYDLKLMPLKSSYSLSVLFDKQIIDGIIFTHDSYLDYLHLKTASKGGKILPAVVINGFDLMQGINQLYVNSYNAAGTMAEYVLSKGYKDVFIIGGDLENADAELRKQAFIDMARKKGIRFIKRRYVNGKFSEQGGYEAVKTVFKIEPKFRGVLFCLNDAMAIGVLRALGELGLHCPGDIKVTGFDDVSQAEFTNPALTTIRFPLSDMGYESVRVIYRILKGELKRYLRKEFPHQLIVRSSC